MIAALDMNSMTLVSGFQPPAIMVEMENASAFGTGSVVTPHSPYFPAPVAHHQSMAVTLTDLLVQLFAPSDALAHELGEKSKRTQADLQAYRVRIEELRADAAQDGYGLNAASERDFWYFIRSEPFIRKGNLVLMDNGNLRAVWKGECGTHIGIQFFGGSTVQYVIFKRRAAVGATSRVAGRDSLEGVKLQLEAFGLRPLIYA